MDNYTALLVPGLGQAAIHKDSLSKLMGLQGVWDGESWGSGRLRQDEVETGRHCLAQRARDAGSETELGEMEGKSKETEAQRSEVTCSKPHSGEAGMWPLFCRGST